MSFLFQVKGLNYLIKNFGLVRALKYSFFKYYFRYRLSKTDFDKQRVIKTNGYKLALVPNDLGISAELAIFKKHEPIHTQLISQEIKPGMICIDLGANIGYYAMLEGKLVGKKGKVICIEPSPTNFSYLKKNIELQQNSNFEAFNFAIGDRDGAVKFLVSNKTNLSRVVSEFHHQYDDQTSTIEVPMKKLDSFLRENPQPKIDLIRMDIEGFEYEASFGMVETLKKFKPILIIEVHTNELSLERSKEFLDNLRKLGYNIKYYFPKFWDFNIISSMKDVKKISIEDLIKNIDAEKGGAFTLFLSADKENIKS